MHIANLRGMKYEEFGGETREKILELNVGVLNSTTREGTEDASEVKGWF
jgi:hypothetical protein